VTLTVAHRRRALAGSAGAAVFVAALGAAMTDLSPWYYSLVQPSWAPPDWLFGPAWTLIFGLTAYAAYLYWVGDTDNVRRRRGLMLFALNGMLNVLWSFLFFKMKRPDWALLEIPLLWISILALMVWVAPASRLASGLLVPYLAWVAFAGYLNRAVVQLNAPFA
jgi:translocator protein